MDAAFATTLPKAKVRAAGRELPGCQSAAAAAAARLRAAAGAARRATRLAPAPAPTPRPPRPCKRPQAPVIVRLVFHDAGSYSAAAGDGGLNASIQFELDRPDNFGLKRGW